MEPDEPVYDCLNLQLKGYDFAVLEACQAEIHRIADIMGVQVDEWYKVFLFLRHTFLANQKHENSFMKGL